MSINILKKIKLLEDYLLQLLFPTTCLNCRKDNVLLCPACLKKIKFLTVQVCPFCENAITDSGKICRLCQKNKMTVLDQLIVSSDYQNKLLTRCIYLYKYRFISSLSTPLSRLLLKALRKSTLSVPDLIIPVPLHPRRLRWRGFNQAEILAQKISTHLLPGIKIPLQTNLIQRKHYTPPQMKIKNYSKRQANIKHAFQLNDSLSIKKGQKILLVDDICTTGATLFECARELRKIYPQSITAIVLARQTIHSSKTTP